MAHLTGRSWILKAQDGPFFSASQRKWFLTMFVFGSVLLVSIFLFSGPATCAEPFARMGAEARKDAIAGISALTVPAGMHRRG